MKNELVGNKQYHKMYTINKTESRCYDACSKILDRPFFRFFSIILSYKILLFMSLVIYFCKYFDVMHNAIDINFYLLKPLKYTVRIC